MKVLLIQPPIQDFYYTSIRTQPIGLAYIASSLREDGHEVGILDCRADRKRAIPIPPELFYLKEFYPFNDRSPFALYSGYYHFGMSWEQIRQEIVRADADVYGISSGFTPYHGEALKVADMVKRWDARKIVIMGGAHVSADPEGVLKSPLVDYVVLGEGERLLPLLLKALEKNGKAAIDGIGCRKNGEIAVPPAVSFIDNLDAVPFPARDLLDPDSYRIGKKRSTMIITSRGCPHRCAYCSAHRTMGTTFRKRSPMNIIEEMKECRERYDMQAFDIEDDNFTFDRERARQLMALIVATFGQERLELSAMNGISSASLDGDLLKAMKAAGFKTVNLSFVSADPSVKERTRRPAAGAGFDEILEEAEQCGLRVTAYGIFGMPGQRIEEMVDTLICLMGKRVLIGPSVYYPTPGTPLFEKCKEDGLLPCHPSQWRSTAFPIQTGDFDRLDLLTLFRLTRTVNFIKGKMEEKMFDEGMTWRELLQVLVERKAEFKPGKPCLMSGALCGKGDALRWIDLLLLLFTERAFFSLKKDSKGSLLAMKEKSSKRVLDYFFERAWGSPVLKSRNE